MKKLFLVASIALFTSTCSAVDNINIAINNKSGKVVEVQDKDGHKTTIGVGGSEANFGVRLHKERKAFPINDLMPHITTLTVRDPQSGHSQVININEHTTLLTINPNLDLEKDN